MKTLLRNCLAVIVGLIAGSCVNMALVVTGPQVFPPPAGVNMADTASLGASIHLLEPRHFLFPFLAHALGTLTGALVAHVIASSRRTMFGFIIGALFLVGGISAAFMIPAPGWFIALDLVMAYLPMAWIGICLGRRFRAESRAGA